MARVVLRGRSATDARPFFLYHNTDRTVANRGELCSCLNDDRVKGFEIKVHSRVSGETDRQTGRLATTAPKHAHR